MAGKITGFPNKEKLEKKKIERVKGLMESREFRKIPLGKITIPENRGIDSDTGLDVLTEEIMEHGLISPVSVAGPYEDGTYKVVEGARRIKSLRSILKGNSIPCYVVAGAVTDRELQLLALGANRVHREDDASLNVKYAQIVFDECVEGWVEEHHTAATLAEMSGLTKKQARKYMRLTKNGTKKLQEAVSQSRMSVDMASAIISAAPDDAAQQNRMADVLSDLPYGTQKAMIAGVKSGEFSSRDRRALDSRARVIIEQEMLRRKQDEEAKEIRKAEEALTKLLSQQELPAPASAYRLVKLCARFAGCYTIPEQERMDA